MAVLLCRYNKPLLPKYKAAEDSVQARQAAIEKKIANRRVNQVQLAVTYKHAWSAVNRSLMFCISFFLDSSICLQQGLAANAADEACCRNIIGKGGIGWRADHLELVSSRSAASGRCKAAGCKILSAPM